MSNISVDSFNDWNRWLLNRSNILKLGADPGTLGEVPLSPLGPGKNRENVGNEREKRRKKGQSGRRRKEKDETEK